MLPSQLLILSIFILYFFFSELNSYKMDEWLEEKKKQHTIKIKIIAWSADFNSLALMTQHEQRSVKTSVLLGHHRKDFLFTVFFFSVLLQMLIVNVGKSIKYWWIFLFFLCSVLFCCFSVNFFCLFLVDFITPWRIYKKKIYNFIWEGLQVV